MWVLSSPDLILIHHGVINEAILLKKNERALTMIIAVDLTPDIGFLTEEFGKFASEIT